MNMIFYYFSKFRINIFSVTANLLSLGIYTRLLYTVNYKVKKVINFVFVIAIFLLVVANTLSIIVKDSILSISQLALVYELFAVNDVIFEFINYYTILICILPIIVIRYSKKIMYSAPVSIKDKEIIIGITLLLIVNFSFFSK